MLKSTDKKVIRGCLRASEHFRTSFLACSQSAICGGPPLSLETVKQLVADNRGESVSRNGRVRREVGTYESEIDFLKGIVNSLWGDVKVKFKIDRLSDAIEILPDGSEVPECSFVLANPDGFRETELSLKHHWLDQERNKHNPNFIWERMSKPQSRTIEATSDIQYTMEELNYLERRTREYCEEKKSSGK